jgi:GH25 family lysozyme M1 (1,4-beta-N-acetylmuramidase)
MTPDAVDIYQLNANNSQGGDGADFPAAKQFGIKGVIHKTSQYRADTLFKVRAPKILAAGLMLGGYHFMTSASPQSQADLMWSVAGAWKDDGLALFADHETYQGYTAPLQSVINFMDAIEQKLGRYAGLYSGNVIKEQWAHATAGQKEYLVERPFWLAQYANAPNTRDYDGVAMGWKNYLWQYTGDGAGPGPHYVPGIGNGVDVSTWAGDNAADFEEWWKTGLAPPIVA